MLIRKADGKKQPEGKDARKAPAAGNIPDTPKRATPKKPKKQPAEKPEPNPNEQGKPHRGRGRPKDIPDVWTPEHIAEVADALWKYVEKTACPSLPEFCYQNGIRRQRLYEFPELVEVKYFLHEKREAYFDRAGRNLTRDDGPRGGFILKALGNVGEFSWTEKSEFAGRLTTTTQASEMSPEERAKWLKENGWAHK